MNPHSIPPELAEKLQTDIDEQLDGTPRLPAVPVRGHLIPRSERDRQARNQRKAIRQQQKRSRRANR